MKNDDSRLLTRRTRQVASAWLALIALMLASLGSAYLPLGAWNAAAGLAIAAVKSAIVLWLFMELGRAGALLRIVLLAALATLALLIALAALDYATRQSDPAPVQTPQQLGSPQAADPLR